MRFTLLPLRIQWLVVSICELLVNGYIHTTSNGEYSHLPSATKTMAWIFANDEEWSCNNWSKSRDGFSLGEDSAMETEKRSMHSRTCLTPESIPSGLFGHGERTVLVRASKATSFITNSDAWSRTRTAHARGPQSLRHRTVALGCLAYLFAIPELTKRKEDALRSGAQMCYAGGTRAL